MFIQLKKCSLFNTSDVHGSIVINTAHIVCVYNNADNITEVQLANGSIFGVIEPYEAVARLLEITSIEHTMKDKLDNICEVLKDKVIM